MAGKQKITVNLTDNVIQELKNLATERGVTATSVLNQAITTEAFLAKEAKNGEILIKKPDGTIKQLVFK